MRGLCVKILADSAIEAMRRSGSGSGVPRRSSVAFGAPKVRAAVVSKVLAEQRWSVAAAQLRGIRVAPGHRRAIPTHQAAWTVPASSA